MNLNAHNSVGSSGSGIDRASTGEETLRLVASLPAPQGLEERVHETLRTVRRQGRVLAWPLVLRADAAWVRATAAAAIVTIVAGGSWGVYSRIQPWQPAKALAAPARVGTMGEFSGADAKRSPQSLQLPQVSAPAKSAVPHQSQKKTHKKGAAPATPTKAAATVAK
ncbi:MAG: hypothetical protein WAL75_19485 [Terracidiphilus sp.]